MTRMMNWFREWPDKHEYVQDIAIKVIALTCKYLLLTVGALAFILGPFVLVSLLVYFFS